MKGRIKFLQRFSESPNEVVSEGRFSEVGGFEEIEMTDSNKKIRADSNKCYVCNELLGPCRNSLESITSFAEVPIYHALGKFIKYMLVKQKLS